MPENQYPPSAHARHGLWLFLIYVIFYAGFMGLSAFAPHRMGEPFLLGVNLAIVYGIGLIVVALLLAFIYMFLCRNAIEDARHGGRP